MQISDLDQLLTPLKDRRRKRIIVAWALDHHTVEAAGRAVEAGIIEATLVGDENAISEACKTSSTDPNIFKIVHESTDIAALTTSIDLINNNKGDLLMKGNLSTDKYMRAILNKERGLMNPGSVLSHVTVMNIPVYHKLLIIGDVAIIPLPDLKQKIAIAGYLIETAHTLGIEKPKLSVLAATEQVLTGMTACVDAAILSKMAERNQIRGALIDGPLSLDLSINMQSVRIKGIKSKVAGDADCILFPNIESGNVFYKANVQYGEGQQAAILVGARVPAVLSSRGDSAKTKLYSIALAAMLAK